MKLNQVGVLIVFGLFVSCSQVPVLEEDRPQPAVLKPDIPQTDEECLAKGGNWANIGLPGTPKRCDIKATDGGKICTDSSQCQGECMAPPASFEGGKAKGTCSEYILNFGCARRVENGKVGMEICAD